MKAAVIGTFAVQLAKDWGEWGLKPIIDSEFPFAEAQQAIQHLEQGHCRGKVIVKIKEV